MNYTEQQVAEALRAFRIQRTVPTDAMRVQKLNEHATIPTYGSSGAAGMDLYANLSAEGVGAISISPGERRLIKTGIAIAIPRGHYARVAPRSGLAYKNGIDVMAGVIDEDYRGEVGVILINLGFKFAVNPENLRTELVEGEPLIVKHGDRIAQLIIEKYTPCLPIEVSSLDDTDRGAGGFGSTGT